MHTLHEYISHVFASAASAACVAFSNVGAPAIASFMYLVASVDNWLYEAGPTAVACVCSCACMCVCMVASVGNCGCVSVFMYVCTYVYVYTYIIWGRSDSGCVSVFMYVCTYVCVYIYTYNTRPVRLWLCVCIHACICTYVLHTSCIYIHMHAYTHTYTQKRLTMHGNRCINHKYEHVHTCIIHMYVYTCMYIHAYYIYVYIYIYIYIYKLTMHGSRRTNHPKPLLNDLTLAILLSQFSTTHHRSTRWARSTVHYFPGKYFCISRKRSSSGALLHFHSAQFVFRFTVDVVFGRDLVELLI